MAGGRKPKILNDLGDYVEQGSFEHQRIATKGEHVRYSEELAEKILARIMKKETIATICTGRDGWPCYDTFFQWCARHGDFMERYKTAHSLQADLFFYDIIHAAQSLQNHPDPNAVRIAIEAFKWVTAKMNPQKYNDKYLVDIKQDKTVSFEWEAPPRTIEHESQNTLPAPATTEFHS
jgi:hypothetical protein